MDCFFIALKCRVCDFLERFVFPDFCTFRFSNRAHFVLPDSPKTVEVKRYRKKSFFY